MESADYTLAAKEFLDSKWSRDVKGRSHELASMIETGKYCNEIGNRVWLISDWH